MMNNPTNLQDVAERPENKPIVKNGKSGVAVMKLKPIKFKDKLNRNRVVLNTKDVFGFLPKVLIIDKVQGASNTIEISAVIPEELQHEKVRQEGSGVAEGAEKAA